MRTALFLALGFGAALALIASTGNRRVTQNPLSPSADTSMTLGGHAITIEYNAPSVRGRKIEGGLVPHSRVWRLGADAATTLTADANLTIGDLQVPKGVYTLFIQGSDHGWTLIVNKQTGQWGLTYDQSQDLGRVAMNTTRLSSPVETLKITLKSTGSSDGTLEITWGNTQATAPIKSR
jgi:hypothetical protein